MVEPIEPNEVLNDSLRALDRTLDEIMSKQDKERMENKYIEDHASHQPMRDGEEIRAFFDEMKEKV